MFTTDHFIWLFLCAAFIIGMTVLSRRIKMSFKCATYIVAAISLASELSKIFTHIEPVMDGDEVVGGVLGAQYLPFHLCSILIFFIFYLVFAKNERTIELVKSFITPIALLGGAIALFIPTSGVDFMKPFAYQCFVYHSGILWYAIYLIMTKQVALGIQSYKRNAAILTALVFIMLWVNSALSIYETNFFFLVKPPMDNLPVLNLNNGWFVYFITLVGIAFAAFTLLHVPFILKEKKEKSVHAPAPNAENGEKSKENDREELTV